MSWVWLEKVVCHSIVQKELNVRKYENKGNNSDLAG